MSRARSNAFSQSGMTLIELMIAMVIGLLVIGGVGAVFFSTSNSVKALDQLARLQESGRFAVTSLGTNIGMANAQYCSGSGGNGRPSGGGILLDNLRAPTVYVRGNPLLNALSDVTTNWGTGAYPAPPTMPFAMPEYLSMRGYDCDTTSCTPVDPSAQVAAIPAQGAAVGQRVVGTDVLTLRYLDPFMGWSLGHPGGSFVTAGAGGRVQSLTLIPLTGEPPITDFGVGDLAMLSDCSLSQVFAVTGQGSATLTPSPEPAVNFDTPNAMTGSKGLRLFDFTRAFNTVTYYLQVVDVGNNETTGALIRRTNGQAEELVRGIERLDFRYGVLNNNGLISYLTANQVDALAPANCPSDPSINAVSASKLQGCMWRAVVSIEIDLLASGQLPLRALTDDELAYSYGALTTPVPPASHAVVPDTNQGFPLNLMRREFTAVVATRNYNP